MPTMMYQCNLQQGDARTVGWIEKRGAKLHASVEVPELGGFWTVTGVGLPPMSKEQLQKKQERDRGSLPSLEKV